MSRHVVIALHGVSKDATATPLGWHQLVESHLHISPHVGIGIFINCEGSRSVLDKEVAQTDINLRQVGGNGLENVRRD
jgi:hypothetical protein